MMKKYTHAELVKLRVIIPALFLCITSFSLNEAFAQPVPAEDENIPFLVTFGNAGLTSWGDDDFCQTFFLSVPLTQKTPIYIRVYDPDCGGQFDEVYGAEDTKTKFLIYGGVGAYSDRDAKQVHPVDNYKSGTLLDSKTFGADPKYDNGWYTFGPFNPSDGEKMTEYSIYYFKIIAQGIQGDDGNLYTYYFSTSASENKRIEGSNAATYEYTFRMPDKAGSVCHLYPYINEDVISVQQHNFDWDSDGQMRIVSYEKKGELVALSSENDWNISKHEIKKTEQKSSLDFQFAKTKTDPKPHNNICFYMTNQFGEFLPFNAIPIGGIPKYKYDGLINEMQQNERLNNIKQNPK